MPDNYGTVHSDRCRRVYAHGVRMSSLYWDDFERREIETVDCLKNNVSIPVRRVAVFITQRCNFGCLYCNVSQTPRTMEQYVFENLLSRYGKGAIIHITGGDPSCVNWLYPLINSSNYKFNLNTNAYIKPPHKNIDRMKISFDSCNKNQFNKLVNRINAFDKVVKHIKEASETSTVSLTCVLSKQTYLQTPELSRFVFKTFPKIYALFFSIYKGGNPAFVLSQQDIDTFYNDIRPKLELNNESLELLNETIDAKFRIEQGIRFPDNNILEPCYLSMSERVIDVWGNEFTCSHLYRDGIFQIEPIKHERCLYGCNTRLVKFNNDVSNKLNRNGGHN